MIRQYIGARYTPKFMGTYDPTQQYENLCVVDNGSGTSYISRKIVPANTPLTNTEYWLVYGASSGAILDLQTRMNTAEGNITDISSDVSDLETDVSTLQGDVTDINEDIAEINDKIEKSGVKKVIIIGDSYVSRNSEALASLVIEKLGLTSGDAVVGAMGSIGFAHSYDGNNFLSVFQGLTIPFDATDVTHVIVIGGANDETESDSDIATAINTFYNYMRTTYVNAELVIGFAGASTTISEIRNIGNACISYYNAVINLNKAHMVKNLEYVMHNRSLFFDTIHPNTAGNNIIASHIAKYILSDAPQVVYTKTTNVTNFRNVYEMINNNMATIWTNARQPFNLVDSYWSRGEAHEIGTINGLITGSYFEDCAVPCSAIVTKSDSTTELTPIVIFVSDGKLSVRNNGKDLANVTAVEIPQFNIQFPTIMC